MLRVEMKGAAGEYPADYTAKCDFDIHTRLILIASTPTHKTPDEVNSALTSSVTLTFGSPADSGRYFYLAPYALSVA